MGRPTFAIKTCEVHSVNAAHVLLLVLFFHLRLAYKFTTECFMIILGPRGGIRVSVIQGNLLFII